MNGLSELIRSCRDTKSATLRKDVEYKKYVTNFMQPFAQGSVEVIPASPCEVAVERGEYSRLIEIGLHFSASFCRMKSVLTSG